VSVGVCVFVCVGTRMCVCERESVEGGAHSLRKTGNINGASSIN